MRLERRRAGRLRAGPGRLAIRIRCSLRRSSASGRCQALPAATTVQTMPFTGFHVPPIGVPGHGGFAERRRPVAVPDCGDAGVLRHPRHRYRCRAGASRPTTRAARRSVIVNQTMARTVWPGENALGKCIRIGFDPSFDPFTAGGPPGPPTMVPCREVVGVARDVRQRSVVPGGSRRPADAVLRPVRRRFRPARRRRARPGDSGAARARQWRRRQPDCAASGAPCSTGAPICRLSRCVRTQTSCAQQMRPWRLGTALLSLFGVAGAGRRAASDSMRCLRTRSRSAGARWRSESRLARSRGGCCE